MFTPLRSRLGKAPACDTARNYRLGNSDFDAVDAVASGFHIGTLQVDLAEPDLQILGVP